MLRKGLYIALFGSLAGAFAGLGVACGVGAGADGSGDGAGGAGSINGQGGFPDDAGHDVAPDNTLPPGPVRYTELCGIDREGCIPGEDLDEPCLPQDGAGGGADGAGGAGGAGGGLGAGGAASFGCQIASIDRRAASVCGPVQDDALLNAQCKSAADCGIGHGCVVAPPDPLIGFCRPYCCGELEACPSETYCAKQQMQEDPKLTIPVCTAVQGCTLLTDGVCGDGQTCAVVRTDGTTSCVPVGTGELCDTCDCAAGYTCNFATGTCRQLCHTSGTGECPSGSTCQGGSANYPEGIGVCVGGTAECAP